MLFVLNSQGTPSIAKIVRIGLPLSIDNNSDDARFFVQQQYYDFLDREPDQGGWDFWTQQITTCIPDPNCVLVDKRASVSFEFFNSSEFQGSGYYVYRMYKGALATIPTFTQFMPDRGLVIGGPNLEAQKQAYADAFVLRSDFVQKYPLSMNGPTFIDALIATIFQTSSVDISDQRQNLINDYNTYGSRSRVVRQAIDDSRFQTAEYNRAFVMMEYYGYLRRNYDLPGFNFYLNNLNQSSDPNKYRNQIRGFITSSEYRRRWGKV
jgi:hypothetical protein